MAGRLDSRPNRARASGCGRHVQHRLQEVRRDEVELLGERPKSRCQLADGTETACGLGSTERRLARRGRRRVGASTAPRARATAARARRGRPARENGGVDGQRVEARALVVEQPRQGHLAAASAPARDLAAASSTVTSTPAAARVDRGSEPIGSAADDDRRGHRDVTLRHRPAAEAGSVDRAPRSR